MNWSKDRSIALSRGCVVLFMILLAALDIGCYWAVRWFIGLRFMPCIELSLLQRCAAHCASGTDIEEAFMSGKTAVEQMVAGQTDKMVGFECDRTNGYTCKAKLFDLSDVANFEKKFPAEWITPEGNNVTEDFIKYAMPLIQGETKLEKENGLPRFARLKKVFAK